MKQNRCVEYVNETDFVVDEDLYEEILGWMKAENVFEPEARCCVKFASDTEVAELNRQYVGREGTTDVLTFCSEIKHIPFLGDIIINIPQADRQRGSGSLQREVARLYIHGLLHLAGLDHLSKTERSRMSSYEDRYRMRLYEVV